MNWFEIASALSLELANSSALTGFTVLLGGGLTTPECNTVRIIRDSNQPKNNTPGQSPQLNLLLECWVKDETEDDRPEVAYKLLAEAEQQLSKLVNDFGKGDKRINGTRIKVEIGTTKGDGDAFRPMVASLTQLTIKWQ